MILVMKSGAGRRSGSWAIPISAKCSAGMPVLAAIACAWALGWPCCRSSCASFTAFARAAAAFSLLFGWLFGFDVLVLLGCWLFVPFPFVLLFGCSPFRIVVGAIPVPFSEVES